MPMPHRIALSAIVRGERHAGLSAARDAIGAVGGWVLDVELFGDMAACLRLEVPASAAGAFADALDAGGVDLDAPSRDALADLATRGALDVPGTLSLTFAQGRGDLRLTKPAVPG
jgi:hypothetical protein